ncbi:MAG: phosphatidate cytidylyltransferase [Synergistaceae bacterium]
MEKLNNKLSNLYVRAFSSIFITGIILLGICLGEYYWASIVSVIALISLWEFYCLLSSRHDISPYIILFSGVFVLLSCALDESLTSMLTAITSVVFISLFVEIIKKQKTNISDAINNTGLTVVGLLYVVLPWSFMMIIRTRPMGLMFLSAMFFCTWSCDVAAYFIGSSLGRNLLCSNVSPKKTWEGFLGGFVASALMGGIIAFYFSYSLIPMVLLGGLWGISGQIGDLAESLLKREAGVKDSSHLIPGHGGFLDRFDSILINSTLAFLLIELIG